MDTPVFDFASHYAEKNPVRCHTPGHKGQGILGWETLDITEIHGADSLYAPDGILAKSQENAARVFGSGATFYSAGGSSQCIGAMLYLARLRAKPGLRPVIAAGRNAHSSFIRAAALLDFDIVWLMPQTKSFSLCGCPITPAYLSDSIQNIPGLAAVFVTSPDYLGAMLDISALAQASHLAGVPLLVDNAHGAYLRFTEKNLHPMDCGADLCCDSAHKTLPVLTGGAYLHVGKNAPPAFFTGAQKGMAMFGSTSPSYLILASLDRMNRELCKDFPPLLHWCIQEVYRLKQFLSSLGWQILPSDFLRITIHAMNSGYTGETLAALLRQQGIYCEYAQGEHLVLLLGAQNTPNDFTRISRAFQDIPVKPPLPRPALSFALPQVYCSLREALLAPSRQVLAAHAAGCVLAAPAVSCPPAVSVVVSGEIIAPDAVEIFRQYGTSTLAVLPPVPGV